MKNQHFHASSILSMLLLIVALSSSGIAQEPRIRQQQQPAIRQQEQLPAQQEKPLVPGLAIARELNQEDLRIALPRECRGIRPDVQTHDAADNFNPPGNPVTLSPTLANYLSSLNLTPKGYDDNRFNKVFADSFKLRNCRVCYATLEVRVKYSGDLWNNDTITVGAAPFNSAPGLYFIYGNIWTPPTPNPKTLSFTLPTAALNQYLSSTTTMPTFLDLITQDDSDVDQATLSVWYY
ncbi:MAG TPA: hypothetical protein VER76_07380 [Pyrinomonadaceae bacterium]|nr:hypothetical protein [Pyrinomonadaceae bacterium]